MDAIAGFTLVAALVCIVVGVLVNMALYRKGAFKAGSLYVGRRLEPVTLSREAKEAERDFYMGLGFSGQPMDVYALRVLKVFICSVFLVFLLMALFIYAGPH